MHSQKELPQHGPLFSGPGAKMDRSSFRLKMLTVAQYRCVDAAKKYAIEQGMKCSLMTGTVQQQQQQMQNAFTVMQKQQAWALMCRVYVGSINFTINEESLRVAFLPFGPIKNINMSMDHVSNKHKGFAFMEFETPEAALLAVDQMNGVMLGGRNIKVGRPSNMPQAQNLIDQFFKDSLFSSRVYVSSIHSALKEEDLKTVFQAFGKVLSCEMPKDLSSKHKGYAYLEFEKQQSALDSVAAMNLFDLGGQLLRVGKAITPASPDLTSPSAHIFNVTTTIKIVPKQSQPVSTIAKQIQSVITVSKQQKTSSEIKNNKNNTKEKKNSTKKNQDSELFSRQGDQNSTNVTNSTITSTTIITSISDVTSSTSTKDISTTDPSKAPISFNNNNVNSNNLNNVDSTISSENKENNSHISLTNNNIKNKKQNNNNNNINNNNINDKNFEKIIENSSEKNKGFSILLENVVSPEDVDEDLKEEMKQECLKFGKVVDVQIQVSQDQQALIYVTFSQSTEANDAVPLLDGRFFAGRKIKASLFHEPPS